MLCLKYLGSTVESTRPPKINKGRVSRSNMRESQCKGAAHDATQSTTEFLVYSAHFMGLRFDVLMFEHTKKNLVNELSMRNACVWGSHTAERKE